MMATSGSKGSITPARSHDSVTQLRRASASRRAKLEGRDLRPSYVCTIPSSCVLTGAMGTPKAPPRSPSQLALPS